MAVIYIRIKIRAVLFAVRNVTTAIVLFSLVLAVFASQPITASGDSLAVNNQGDAPSVSISYATPRDVHRVRINSPISLQATFSEPVYGFAIEDVRLVNGLATDFSGGDGDTSYTFRVTPNAIGAVTVDIAAGVAEDVARNLNTAASQFYLGIPYDDDRDGAISIEEAVAAIRDYFRGTIDIQHAVAILRLYFSSGPDLVVPFVLLVGNPSGADGNDAITSSFTINSVVRNSGDKPSNSTILRVYRSTDTTITNNDTEVGSVQVSGLGASWARSFSINLTAPSAAGVFYYGVCVDPVPSEIDAENNCSGSQALSPPTTTERDLYQYFITSMNRLASKDPAFFGRLSGQPWFNNDLAEDKMALIVTMPSIAHNLIDDLIESHYVKANTVSLSLADDVNIWVFQNTPFPQDEDLVTIIEDVARMSENLLKTPFPTTDVILLVVDRSEKRYTYYSGHYDSHIQLARYYGRVNHIPHEMAHYYFFAPLTGPRWLTEGAAELIAAHYNHMIGNQNLDNARSAAAWLAQFCFDHDQIENIRHLMHIVSNNLVILRPEGCIYDMGEDFLYKAEMTMGQAAVMSALGELHVSKLGVEPQTVEENIYDVFLKHVPIDRQEDFREMYQKLHGVAAAFPAVDYSDDHGDEAAVATEVEVRQVVHGSLDYMFDFDYFRFLAEEDQTYRIEINHPTLRPTSLGLYDPDGQTGENHRWKSRDASLNGPQIVWTAQSTREYFVAVHNFGGRTGSYTLTITPVVRSALDDYGDTMANATEISIGEVVTGTVNDHFDIDYFEFQVEADQTYLLDIEGGTLKEFRFRIMTPDRRHYRFTADDEFLNSPDGFMGTWERRLPFRWTGDVSGEASLAIDGVAERVGTYSLKVVHYED